jgi:hypothetical protein
VNCEVVVFEISRACGSSWFCLGLRRTKKLLLKFFVNCLLIQINENKKSEEKNSFSARIKTLLLWLLFQNHHYQSTTAYRRLWAKRGLKIAMYLRIIAQTLPNHRPISDLPNSGADFLYSVTRLIFRLMFPPYCLSSAVAQLSTVRQAKVSFLLF